MLLDGGNLNLESVQRMPTGHHASRKQKKERESNQVAIVRCPVSNRHCTSSYKLVPRTISHTQTSKFLTLQHRRAGLSLAPTRFCGETFLSIAERSPFYEIVRLEVLVQLLHGSELVLWRGVVSEGVHLFLLVLSIIYKAVFKMVPKMGGARGGPWVRLF